MKASAFMSTAAGRWSNVDHFKMNRTIVFLAGKECLDAQVGANRADSLDRFLPVVMLLRFQVQCGYL